MLLDNCFLVMLQSCLCFGGRRFLLIKFGCISSLDFLPFPLTPDNTSFPKHTYPHTCIHYGGIHVMSFRVAAE